MEDFHTYFVSELGVWGHKKGEEFWRKRDWAEALGMTQAEFNDYMNDPKFYAWQDIASNRSHTYEQH